MGLILRAADLEAGSDVTSGDCMLTTPFMETEWVGGGLGSDQFRELPPPRVMKTHLPLQLFQGMLQKYPDVKIVQTIRNPKDTLVSMFHHLRGEMNLGGFQGTWDQFFEELVKKKRLPWGDYFQHNVEWYTFNKNRDNSLILKYEDMKKDHRGHVIKIAKFMGCDLSDKVIDIIVTKTTTKDMSQAINPLIQAGGWDVEKSTFIRKGVVGDWINYFSKEQSEYVDAKTKEFLEPLGLKFEYSS